MLCIACTVGVLEGILGSLYKEGEWKVGVQKTSLMSSIARKLVRGWVEPGGNTYI